MSPSDSIYDFFSKQQQRHAILRSHQDKILYAIYFPRKLTIEQAIQFLLLHVLGSKKVHDITINELIKYYCDGLKKIKGEVKEPRNRIKIESGIFGAISNDEFIEDLSRVNLHSIQSLNDWSENIRLLSSYVIDKRYICNILSKLELNSNVTADASSTQARVRLGVTLILEVLNELPVETIEKTLNVGHGKKGLKALVREKIEEKRKDFFKIYPQKNSFKYCWGLAFKEFRAINMHK